MELITDITVVDGLTDRDHFKEGGMKEFPRIVKGEHLTGDFLREFMPEPVLGGKDLHRKMDLMEVKSSVLTMEKVSIYDPEDIRDSYDQEYRPVPKQIITLEVTHFNGA